MSLTSAIALKSFLFTRGFYNPNDISSRIVLLQGPLTSITNRQPITPSWISRAQTNSRLLVNHDSFTIAEVAGLMDEPVASRHQSFLSVTRKSVRLIHQFIGQPLMMNPRRVDRLLNIHVVIDHVRDYVEDCVYDCWTTRAANRKPKAA